MNNEVYYGKTKIDRGMANLVFPVTERKQRDTSLDDPKEKKTAYKKSHPLHRMFFQGAEIVDNVIPHG